MDLITKVDEGPNPDVPERPARNIFKIHMKVFGHSGMIPSEFLRPGHLFPDENLLLSNLDFKSTPGVRLFHPPSLVSLCLYAIRRDVSTQSRIQFFPERGVWNVIPEHLNNLIQSGLIHPNLGNLLLKNTFIYVPLYVDQPWISFTLLSGFLASFSKDNKDYIREFVEPRFNSAYFTRVVRWALQVDNDQRVGAYRTIPFSFLNIVGSDLTLKKQISVTFGQDFASSSIFRSTWSIWGSYEALNKPVADHGGFYRDRPALDTVRKSIHTLESNLIRHPSGLMCSGGYFAALDMNMLMVANLNSSGEPILSKKSVRTFRIGLPSGASIIPYAGVKRFQLKNQDFPLPIACILLQQLAVPLFVTIPGTSVRPWLFVLFAQETASIWIIKATEAGSSTYIPSISLRESINKEIAKSIGNHHQTFAIHSMVKQPGYLIQPRLNKDLMPDGFILRMYTLLRVDTIQKENAGPDPQHVISYGVLELVFDIEHPGFSSPNVCGKKEVPLEQSLLHCSFMKIEDSESESDIHKNCFLDRWKEWEILKDWCTIYLAQDMWMDIRTYTEQGSVLDTPYAKYSTNPANSAVKSIHLLKDYKTLCAEAEKEKKQSSSAQPAMKKQRLDHRFEMDRELTNALLELKKIPEGVSVFFDNNLRRPELIYSLRFDRGSYNTRALPTKKPSTYQQVAETVFPFDTPLIAGRMDLFAWWEQKVEEEIRLRAAVNKSM